MLVACMEEGEEAYERSINSIGDVEASWANSTVEDVGDARGR